MCRLDACAVRKEYTMSQPDSITLSIDEENDGAGLVDVDYLRYDGSLTNRSVYIAEDHVLDARHALTFYRTPPKPNGNFKGVAKSAFKFTKDYTVLGVDGSNLVSPVIVEVSFSIPVGVTAADSLIEMQRSLALLDYDVVMAPLNDQQMI